MGILSQLARGKEAYTKILKFRIVLEFNSVAGSFSATCPELRGCASAGGTEEEAGRNIEEAIRLYLAPAEIELPHDAKVLEATIGERGTLASPRIK